MARLNHMGWTVSISPITGKVVITRIGIPGQIELPQVDGVLCARIVDENDQVVASAMEHGKNMEFKKS